MRRRRMADRIVIKRESAAMSFISVLLVMFALIAVYVKFSQTRHFLHFDFIGCGCWGKHEVNNATLLVSADGTYYWDERGPYPLDHFATQLGEWLKAVKHPHVLIRADSTARHGDAVSLLDEVRKRGLQRVTFETRTRSTP